MRLFSSSRDADMTQGNITAQLLRFSFPMMFGLLFQQFYNTVDTIVVGQYVGKEALAAVGSTGSIINTLVGFGTGLFSGASVLVSQYYGAHDENMLKRTVHTTVSMAIVLSAVITVLGLLLVRPLLNMMSTPEDVFSYSESYLFIYFLGSTGLMFYNMGASILRAVGDSRRPLYILCFSAAVNIALDLFFVLSLHMGVQGVALATIISQFASAILVMAILSREPSSYGVKWKQLRFETPIFKKIFSLGFPSGIQQAITSFSNVFVQSYINQFGSACMAGWSAYNKVDIFILIPVQSIALASATFVGQNYGAKQVKRVREGVKKSLFISIGITVLLSAVVMLFATQVLRLFTSEEDVLEFGRRFIYLISPFYFCLCINQVLAGALRGIGNAKGPMFIMLFSFVVFRQIYLFSTRFFQNSFVLVAFGYPFGWLLCSLLLIRTYLKSELFSEEGKKIGTI